ncbi:Lipoprotein-anchoring transpeptidase ErfK/SrfK [Thermanaeromonas toyohensis ToBE]|uniref:Lipoprotein-anchoring transpeptidase ErfK/SrfK n=2 Tax=Thermanaeromonas TaxID=202949 RepID=A0A1W1W3W2_9FIRM|nr:Lipoprotein-anchoring transpeptidase ErfK/SrfK [Thermanaeromonas toyohensis ToBE]
MMPGKIKGLAIFLFALQGLLALFWLSRGSPTVLSRFPSLPPPSPPAWEGALHPLSSPDTQPTAMAIGKELPSAETTAESAKSSVHNPTNKTGTSRGGEGVVARKEIRTGGRGEEAGPGESPVQAFVPPKKGYWIEVLVGSQKMRIYQEGQLKKEWVVSTGTPDKPTPLGVFAIQNRGEWFYNPKYNQGAKWWVSFKDWGVYLFHSLPMDRDQRIIPEEALKLGTPASHGCVRLEVDNAKWIYDHIPQGTPVYIHE